MIVQSLISTAIATGDNPGGVNPTAVTAATYAITATEVFVKADTTSNAIAFTAPSPAVRGRKFTIKKISTDANAITLVQNASEKIENTAATYTCIGSTLAARYDWTFESDGTDWWLV